MIRRQRGGDHLDSTEELISEADSSLLLSSFDEQPRKRWGMLVDRVVKGERL